jgi:hypothetical protein
LTLILVPIAIGLWFARYTGLFSESGTFWLVSGLSLTIITSVAGSVFKIVPEGWVKDAMSWVTTQLRERSIFCWVWGAFAAGVVVSLWFGGFQVKGESGAGSAQVAIYPEGTTAPDHEEWEPKTPFYHTRRTPPGGERGLTVAIKGVPKKSFTLTPWFRSGKSQLDYPRDFLSPVVLIVTEKHLVDKAKKYPGSLQLSVTVNGTETRADFDGHALWVGCEATDEVTVPDEKARADWPNTADPEFVSYVKRPKDDPILSRPLASDVDVAVALYEDGHTRELKAPAAVRTGRPKALGELVQVLTLYVK